MSTIINENRLHSKFKTLDHKINELNDQKINAFFESLGLTERNDVVKKGTIPNTSNDSFNSFPSFVNKVNMNIKPVKVKYLHFTINCAMVLKNGITEA